MTEIPYLAVLDVEGSDAHDYLHRQLSANINGLGDGGATFACLCSPKGRVIALLYLQQEAGSIRLACSAELAGNVQQILERFVMRDDVRIAHREDLVVTGGADGEGLPEYGFADRPEDYGVFPAGFKRAELANGVAWLGSKTTDSFLPQMLGYEAIGALSFRKGCFPGQEVIARTRYLGRLKRQPVILSSRVDLQLLAGDSVTLGNGDESVSAVVIDSAFDGDQDTIFAVARSEVSFAVRTLESGQVSSQVESHWPLAED